MSSPRTSRPARSNEKIYCNLWYTNEFYFGMSLSGLIWIPTRALVLLGWFFTRRALRSSSTPRRGSQVRSRGADHDSRTRDPNALALGVCRRKRDGTDGGAEAEILRHLEPPHGPLQRARRAQHAVRGIVDEHHRIPRFERGVLYLLFALFELAAEVSCKMLPNHRITEHARKAAEIALCRAFEDLALAPAIAVSDDGTGVERANVVARCLGDNVVEGGVDQVMPLRRQPRLGSFVFDIVRSPKHLDVFLFPVATHHAQETKAVQSAERVRIRSLEPLFL